MATKRKTAATPEEREHQMVNLAYDEAERQMRAGTASSQVITQFLRLGTTRERLEQQRLEAEVRLAESKIQAMGQAGELKELMVEAVRWFRGYSGQVSEEEMEELQNELD